MGAVRQRHYCPSCGMVGSESDRTFIKFVRVNGLLKSLRHPMTDFLVSDITGLEGAACVGGMVEEKAP